MKKIIPVSFFFLAATVCLVYFVIYERKDLSDHDLEYASDSPDLKQGEMLFTQYCSSCHGIQEDGFGPRLGGITTLLSKKELMDFVNDPAQVIESGDIRSNHQKGKYKLLMPPFGFLEDTQISDILSYIHRLSKELRIEPLEVNTTSASISQSLISPVKKSGLKIELQDYVQIPVTDERPSDKGIATLRAHPSGDGTLFVSDQMGMIYQVNDAQANPFLNVKEQIENFIFEPGIGTGLGSFALHPGFLENGLIYTTHTEMYLGKPAINDGAFPDSLGVGLQWVLSEWKLNDISAKVFEGSRREVLRLNTPTTAHGVQDIGFPPVTKKNDPDYGMLYLGIGDGGSNNLKMPELCHNKRSLLGTVIRVDPRGNNSATHSYGIPPDNPFIDHTDPLVRKEIWAYGFRNPHRMCWDMAYGKRMLVADIGESNIEEVNVIQKGGDYGWSILEGNYGISPKVDLKVVHKANEEELSKYSGPFGQYDHNDGNAISGGFVYEGPLTELQDKYFFGDIVTGRLFYMNIDKELSDSAVYDVSIVKDDQETYLKQIINSDRIHLRIGYDPYSKQLFIMTKGDGMIRKVVSAYYEEDQVL